MTGSLIGCDWLIGCVCLSISDGNKIPLIKGANFSNGEFRFTLNPLGENGEFCARPNMYLDIEQRKALQGAQAELTSLRQSACSQGVCDLEAQGKVRELEMKVTELERKMTEPKKNPVRATSPRHSSSNVDARDEEAWHPKLPTPASQL